MSFTDPMTDWAGDETGTVTLPCGCTRFIADTLEETLACPRPWEYYPGIGWVHALGGPE